MKTPKDEYHRLREALFLEAALVDEFSPRALLQQVLTSEHSKDILLRGKLMSALRQASTGAEDSWQLRPVQRRKVLADMPRETVLPETDIGTALKGEDLFAPEHLRSLAVEDVGITDLSRVVSTLEQAGPSAPGHAYLMGLSSRLDRLRRDAATDNLLGDNFTGRDTEIDQLLNVLDHPQRTAPLQTLHIQGLPGVGKTFLLEELSRQCRSRPHIVMIRLDFDRSSLRDGNVEAVFEEISRQMGAAMPALASELHTLRLRHAERRTKVATRGRGRVPFELLHSMVEILAAHDRQVLFLLDTLEVLHGYGATYVHRLLNDLDRFADKERLDISLISAGRDMVFGPDDERLRDFIPLDRLDDEVTAAILEKRNVPDHLRDRIIALSRGNPLRLVLIARAVQESDDGAELGDDQIRFADTGYLYRAVLSRVPVEIREIATNGLILPELNTGNLIRIVAPVLGLSIDKREAKRLLELLEMQRWLVRGSAGKSLSHVPAVRREILELTYAQSPGPSYEINASAADQLGEREPLLALYHRLQMTRGGDEMPEIDRALARRFNDDLMEDLPADAQDAVLRARGQRSKASRPASGAPPRSRPAPAGPFTAGGVTGFASPSPTPSRESSPAPSRPAAPAAGPPAAPSVTPVLQEHIARTDTVWLKSDPDTPRGRLKTVSVSGPVQPPDKGAVADLRNMLEQREKHEATFILKHQFADPVRLDSDAGVLALVHQWLTGHWSLVRSLFGKLPEDRIMAAIRDDIGLTGLALLEIWAEFRFDDLHRRVAKNTELQEAVDYALSLTQRGGLRNGALSMLWLAAGGAEKDPEKADIDVVARYADSHGPYAGREVAERSGALRSEFGMSFETVDAEPVLMPPDDYARLVAPLNPYVDPLRALLEDIGRNDTSRTIREITQFGSCLSELAMRLAPGVTGAKQAQDRMAQDPGEVVDLLNGLGLFAEFATGYAWYNPVPDLPTVARAAERWQMATLGLWRYGRSVPDVWQASPDNMLLTGQISAIMADPDPTATALRLLRIWGNPLNRITNRPPDVLRRRLSALYSVLLKTSDPRRRNNAMERAGLPLVLRAPVTVLTDLDVPFDVVFNA